MLSFIVPAHNEQPLIGRTLGALHAAARALREPYEVIVADDASTDETAAIARAHGAQVVSVNHRQIAATRNAGARQARGELLFFVDADTLVPAAAVGEAVRAMRRGAVGGGCVFRFDGQLPLWVRIVYPLAVPVMRLAKLVGGCSLFCRRDVFRAVGGFDEGYYAAEEMAFIAALKHRGRFIIPRACVTTSGRKVRTLPARELLAPLVRVAIGGQDWFRRREGLEVWYGPRQPDPEETPNQPLQQTGHADSAGAHHPVFSRVSRLLSFLFGKQRGERRTHAVATGAQGGDSVEGLLGRVYSRPR